MVKRDTDKMGNELFRDGLVGVHSKMHEGNNKLCCLVFLLKFSLFFFIYFVIFVIFS